MIKQLHLVLIIPDKFFVFDFLYNRHMWVWHRNEVDLGAARNNSTAFNLRLNLKQKSGDLCDISCRGHKVIDLETNVQFGVVSKLREMLSFNGEPSCIDSEFGKQSNSEETMLKCCLQAILFELPDFRINSPTIRSTLKDSA